MQNNRNDIGLLVLRLMAGGLIAFHGFDKMASGIGGFQGMVDSLGLPLPTAFAWAVALFELVGGLLVMAGFATRWASMAFVALFLGTTFYVKFGQMGAGLISGEATAEADLLYLGAFAALAMLGAGAFSADAKTGRETPARSSVPVS
jgi:putative oxidoreductase